MNLPCNYTQITMYCANSDDQLITVMYQKVHKMAMAEDNMQVSCWNLQRTHLKEG
jgi:hypothetical protein